MRKFALSVLAATIMMIGGAAAQTDYPTHPIRLIVPFAPGGSTDSQARVLADYLGRALGQQVVVVNVGGAGGTIGLNQGAKADAGRLHAGDGDAVDDDQSLHSKEHPLRPDQGFRADRAGGHQSDRAGGAQGFEDQDRARFDRDGQGEAGANPLRQRRDRIGDAFEHGAVRDDGRRRAGARALSRRRAGPARRDRGPHRPAIRERAERAGPRAQRHLARRGGRLGEAIEPVPGFADHRRNGPGL